MSALSYRPGLDGLRALAVLAVMTFHLDRRLLPGGFVGVDVFFVLSGYLITSLIVAELRTGDFSAARFYQRRIARIFPGSFLVLAFVLLVTWRLYTPQDFASAGITSAFAAMSLTNVKLMLLGSYFQVSPDAQPLLHFWSLAVEEQFYLILPLLLWGSYRLRARERTLGAGLGFLAVASFAACIVMTHVRPDWAFYLLPTRAWELLAGGLLGLRHLARSAQSEARDRWLGVAGLAIVAVSFAAIQEGPAFPGLLALVPVLGTLLVLAARSGHSVSERWLSWRPLVAIGKCSYSLYIWHWPIFCFVDYGRFTASTAERVALKIALTLVSATGAYLLFEKPLRARLNLFEWRRVAYASFATCVVVVAGTGTWVRRDNYVNATESDVARGGVEFESDGEHLMVVVGDSNGSMYARTLRDIARDLHLRLRVLTVDGGDPLPTSSLFPDIVRAVEQQRPDVTVLVADWRSKLAKDPTRVDTAVRTLLRNSGHVILLSVPPILPEDSSRESVREHGLVPLFEPEPARESRARTTEYLRSLQGPHVHVLEVAPYLLASDGSVRFIDAAGHQLWHNPDHLSYYGANLIRPALEALTRLLLTGS